MLSPTLNLIAIGYAKRALETGSRERLRMKQYASVLSEYHVIVFTRKSDNLPAFQQDGNLFLYGTNTKSRIGMMIKAIRIGRQIVKQKQTSSWVVSCQDPFETSFVGRFVSCGQSAINHVQIHGDMFNQFCTSGSLMQKFRVLYGQYVVKRTTNIRVVSERIKNSLVELGVKASSIFVLPIQADLEEFLVVGRERPAAAPAQPPRFLYVGRFATEKNLNLLLEAFAQVATNQKEIILTLAGDGPEKSNILNFINSHQLQSQIKVTEWTNDVAGLMRENDVFCLASNHEGWGMVLVEAAAAGMAVVTTNVGCAGEFIENDKQGLVVPVGRAAAYAAALQTYLSTPELISKHANSAHQKAKAFSLTKDEYLDKFINSYTF